MVPFGLDKRLKMVQPLSNCGMDDPYRDLPYCLQIFLQAVQIAVEFSAGYDAF